LQFLAKNVSNASSGLTATEIDVSAPEFLDWDSAKQWTEQLAVAIRELRLNDVEQGPAWDADTSELPRESSKTEDSERDDETIDDPSKKPFVNFLSGELPSESPEGQETLGEFRLPD